MTFILIDSLVERKFNNIIHKYKEHLYITMSIIFVILMLLVVRLIFGVLNEDFWLSLIPNVITDLIGIIVATYIINILLNKKQVRDEKSKAYEMIGKKYEGVVINISRLYINGLKREPVTTPNEVGDVQHYLEQMNNLINSIEFYVDENFYSNLIHIIYVDWQKNTSDINQKIENRYLDRLDYTDLFKNEANVHLERFITKYLSVLPNELRELLFLLENNLQSGVLMNPKVYGLHVNLSLIKFDVEEYRVYYRELGITIIRLLNYFQKSR